MQVSRQRQSKAFRYLEKVMRGAGGVLDAVTWHHYYLDGHTAAMEDFLRVATLENLRQSIAAVEDTLRGRVGYRGPVWLGETASAYGGGAHGLSDRFVSVNRI